MGSCVNPLTVLSFCFKVITKPFQIFFEYLGKMDFAGSK